MTTEPPHDPDTSKLPVPATDDRPYLHIQPSTTGLTTRTVTANLRKLHGLQAPGPDGWLTKFRPQRPPTVEWILATDGRAHIDYYLGVEPADSLDALRPLCRSLFPADYQIQREQWHPKTLLPADQATAAVVFQEACDRRDDWQTQLTPFEHFQTEANARIPLATIAEVLAESDVPLVFQALVQPYPDQTTVAAMRERQLQDGTDTLWGSFVNTLFESASENYEPPAADQQRLDELAAKDLRHPFVVNARAVAVADREAAAERVARQCTSAFGDVSNTTTDITARVATGRSADTVRERLLDRTIQPLDDDVLGALTPGASTTAGMIADPSELGDFCLVDGNALPPDAQRALETVPETQTAITRPPASVLEPFRDDGLAIGRPQTHDGTTAAPIAIPPTLQTLHVAFMGRTGDGKSVGVNTAHLHNHAVTDGPTIFIQPKGGSAVIEYLQAHYEKFGTLDDVVYFDCAEWVPAIPFFDIRSELDAAAETQTRDGAVTRQTIVEERVAHYLEIIRRIMGPDRFENAAESVKVLEAMLYALYDPVHGEDVFGQDDLHAALRRMHDQGSAPAVSQDQVRDTLEAKVATTTDDTFTNVMNGALNRVEELTTKTCLDQLFTHPGSGDDAPRFDIGEFLDEDVVIIFDTGRLRPAVKRGVTLVLLSHLWTALKRRKQRTTGDETTLVNLVIEEAASVANSHLLTELLSEGRGFNLGVTMAMQFPGQLETADESVYEELLNNTGSLLAGTIGVDHDLARRFATGEMDRAEAAARLRSLSRGEWLANLPGEFGTTEPTPFVVESMPLPDGHPDADGSIDDDAFTAAYKDCVTTSRATYGRDLAQGPGTVSSGETETAAASPLLARTARMPDCVEYDSERDVLQCATCQRHRFEPTLVGLRNAVACCHDLDAVDTDDIPVCSTRLTLTPAAIAASDWSHAQLLFLQLVYDAQQQRHHSLEYDIVRDSMTLLREYADLDQQALDALVDAGLLRDHGPHPHRLYTVTTAGRDVIGESYTYGEEFGEGVGDIGESSVHVYMVELARRWLVVVYAENPDSEVVKVRPYYELGDRDLAAAAFMGSDAADETAADERRRLDLVGLDADGAVVVAVEAERITNDVAAAAPTDFDTLADCDPEEAIWVVMNREAGTELVDALNDPADGEPRVEKTYSANTPPRQFRIDTPGLTDVYTVGDLASQVDPD